LFTAFIFEFPTIIRGKMNTMRLLLISALLAILASAGYVPLPPEIVAKMEDCIAKGGTYSFVYQEQNETEGPQPGKDLPPKDVICELPEKKTSSVCDDGTRVGECSITQPLKCTTKGFIEKCSICGCPPGAVCAGESCETTTSTTSTTTTSTTSTTTTLTVTSTSSTSSSTSSTIFQFTTSSTIPSTTTSTPPKEKPEITGKATSSRGSATKGAAAFGIGLLLAYAIVKIFPSSPEAP
jgi:hypothetical protein